MTKADIVNEIAKSTGVEKIQVQAIVEAFMDSVTELNMMMRMMLGSKLQSGLDQAVEGLAKALNSFR